jgi:hypothetical protein
VANGQFIVHPRCVRLIAHMKHGRWNDNRTAFDRPQDRETYGHFDLVACAMYLWLKVAANRHLNPNAPFRPSAQPGQIIVDTLPWQKNADRDRLSAINGLMGMDKRNPWDRPRRPNR